MQATPGPAGHPSAVLCQSGWGLACCALSQRENSDPIHPPVTHDTKLSDSDTEGSAGVIESGVCRQWCFTPS